MHAGGHKSRRTRVSIGAAAGLRSASVKLVKSAVVNSVLVDCTLAVVRCTRRRRFSLAHSIRERADAKDEPRSFYDVRALARLAMNEFYQRAARRDEFDGCKLMYDARTFPLSSVLPTKSGNVCGPNIKIAPRCPPPNGKLSDARNNYGGCVHRHEPTVSGSATLG